MRPIDAPSVTTRTIGSARVANAAQTRGTSIARLGAAVLGFALVLAALWMQAAPARANTARAARALAPVIHLAGNRGRANTAAAYTIHDTGGPSAKLYPQGSYPVALNNSGQILGYAGVVRGTTSTQDCVLYTGSGFSDFTASANEFGCTPGGISSVDSSGEFRVVGSLDTVTNSSSVPFLGSVNVTTGHGGFTVYQGNSQGQFNGVNLSGETVGSAYFAPYGGFFSPTPLFVVPAGTQALEVGQTQCTTQREGCATVRTTYPWCPFGGCAINDSGLILGYDQSTGQYMTYTYGSPDSARELPLTSAATYVSLNNAGQVVYANYQADGYPGLASIYSLSSRKTTAIPAIKGNSCTAYTPISINNAGGVLGYTADCPNNDSIYWTWDSVHGTQNLNAELPATTVYATITPIGMNDSGQILAALTLTPTGMHWGILNPPTPAARK